MGNTQRRKALMLTLESVISVTSLLVGVLGLCGTMFAIGYTFGRDSRCKKKHKK